MEKIDLKHNNIQHEIVESSRYFKVGHIDIWFNNLDNIDEEQVASWPDKENARKTADEVLALINSKYSSDQNAIELNHTQGEWGVFLPRENFEYPNSSSFIGRNGIIYKILIHGTTGMAYYGTDEDSADIRLKNAYLKAAAPLLLAALMEAVEDQEDMKDLADHQYPDNAPHEHPEWYEKAKAAIAKATNTTQP